MTFKSAVVDTSVILRLAEPQPDANSPDYSEWASVRATIQRCEDDGAAIVIPAPVFAELAAGGTAGYQIAQRLLAQMGGLRIEALDRSAAEIAGRMTHVLISQVPRGQGVRVAVKFDALIAAVAVRCSVSHLIMAGDRYFQKALSAVGSPIAVVDARQQFAPVVPLKRTPTS